MNLSVCLSIYISLYIYLQGCFYATDSTIVEAQMRASKRKMPFGAKMNVISANQLGSSSHFHRRQREKTKPPSKSYMGVSNATCLAGYSIKLYRDMTWNQTEVGLQNDLTGNDILGFRKKPCSEKKTCSGCPGFNGPMPGLQVAQPQRQVRLLRPKGLTTAI